MELELLYVIVCILQSCDVLHCECCESFNLLLICRLFKPATFADCLGDELPFGWEAAYNPQVGTYYINHLTRKTSQNIVNWCIDARVHCNVPVDISM